FLVSQLARRHVTTALTGDAGDELFCGYNRYQFTAGLWRTIGAGPLPLRRLAAKAIGAIPVDSWNALARATAWCTPRRMRHPNPGDKLHKGAQVLSCATLDALYLGLVSHWDEPAAVVPGALEPATLLSGGSPQLAGLDGMSRMMALDLLGYLPDD